jgi:cytochrome c553
MSIGIMGAILMASLSLQALDLSRYELLGRAAKVTPDPTHGKQLYEEYCVRCHRPQGSGTGERQYPQLAGQQEQYVLEQLVDFVTLDRFAPKMHQILAQGTLADPQSLRDLSAYLAIQPRDVHGEHGDGYRIGRGRQIFNQYCAECHGTLGEGRAKGPVPAVDGQNYTYLLAQLKGFVAGHRSRAEPALIGAVSKLSPDDMAAVADFMSRMPDSLDAH